MKQALRWILGGVALSLLVLFLFLWTGISRPTEQPVFGMTWSNPYASSLGIDPWSGLQATLDELHVKLFRIPAYWPDLQPEQGPYNWYTLDRQMRMLQDAGAKAYVVVGRKQPRWPEFWTPEWVMSLTPEKQEEAQLAYVEAVVGRYAKHPALAGWQVENEPSFGWGFGTEQLQSREFVQREMELVKKIDPRHLVYTSESGELSSWIRFRKSVDTVGISTYRVITNPRFGTIRYWFVPPYLYAHKAWLVRPWMKNIFVSEFQMEPWADQALTELTPEEQFKTFDTKQMEKNFWFAERMQLSPVLFWGAEWWYWMKTKGHPEFWDAAKLFFAKHQ
jgi:hypothetical protein